MIVWYKAHWLAFASMNKHEPRILHVRWVRPLILSYDVSVAYLDIPRLHSILYTLSFSYLFVM